jgi:hypothetical protein
MARSAKVCLLAFCCVAIVGIASNQAYADLCGAGSLPECVGKVPGALCNDNYATGTCITLWDDDPGADCLCLRPGPAVSNGGFIALALGLVGMAVWASYRRSRISAT